eukprot:scaffold13606_cov100-Cyclotella_meneghiniana.AAC.2
MGQADVNCLIQSKCTLSWTELSPLVVVVVRPCTCKLQTKEAFLTITIISKVQTQTASSNVAAVNPYHMRAIPKSV